jgi:proteic killer suppression protein
VIISFKDSEVEKVWNGVRSKRFSPDVQRRALIKLNLIDSSEVLQELRVPPGNRLEALKGDRAGQYSIRLNDQWRICFVWTKRGAKEIEIVDYH